METVILDFYVGLYTTLTAILLIYGLSQAT